MVSASQNVAGGRGHAAGICRSNLSSAAVAVALPVLVTRIVVSPGSSQVSVTNRLLGASWRLSGAAGRVVPWAKTRGPCGTE